MAARKQKNPQSVKQWNAIINLFRKKASKRSSAMAAQEKKKV
jgi:hypothetical protein